MRQFVHTMFITDNHDSFHLWLKKNLVKHQEVPDLEPVTPNHLLIGKSSPNYRPYVSHEQDISPRKKWKAVQAATEKFWRRWLKEYLPTLTEKKRWQVENRNFKIGDLVLISDENMHRSDWPLAKIIKIRPCREDVVQVLKVKTTNGEYVRPAGNLCLLEHSSFYNNNE